MTRFVLAGSLIMAAACGPSEPGVPESLALSAEDALDMAPTPSPDGSLIAFWRPGPKGNVLWVADADMGNPRSLEVYTSFGAQPLLWSPDGQRIAAVASLRNPGDLVTVRVTDGTVTSLVESPQFKAPVQFHPDGDRLIYAALTPDGSVSGLVVSQSSLEVRPLVAGITTPYFGVVSPDGRSILAVVFGEGANTLWAADGDGTNLRQLTNEGFEALGSFGVSPFSPDGNEILYTSTRTGKRDVWVASLANGTTRQLTTEIQDDYDPSWSPDGRSIAFLSNRGRQTDIWVMPAAGGEAVRITDSPEAEAWVRWVGNEALSFSVNHSPGALWTRSLADGTETRLTPDSVNAGAFAISSDRTRLAFRANLPGAVNDLAVMSAEGGTIETVSRAADHDYIVWSRDGRRLAYTSTESGSQDIWIVEPGTSTPPRQLTNWVGVEQVMDWSADGAAIYAYAERESQLGDIWKVPVDGSEPERLTTSGSAVAAVISWVREAQEILVLQLDGGIQVVVKRTSAGRLTPFTNASDGNVGNFGVSPDGEIAVLSFLRGGQVEGRLVRWTDGSPLVSLPPNSGALNFSRDSRRLLYGIFAGVGNMQDLGILDVATGDTLRVTATPEAEPQAAFTADGNAVILRRVRIAERVMRVDVSGVVPRPTP